MDRQDAKEELDRIAGMMERTDRLQDAQEELFYLMDSVDPRALATLREEIVTMIDEVGTVTKGRRSEILDRLRQLTRKATDEQQSRRTIKPKEARDFRRQLEKDLRNLSQEHIFTWATFYRDTLVKYFDWSLELGMEVQDYSTLLRVIQDEYRDHSAEIFSKGYHYTTQEAGTPHSAALTKSKHGIQRFLELPIDYYSGKASRERAGRSAILLRDISSAFLTGILDGFSEANLGPKSGRDILAERPECWLNFLGFLVEDDLRQIADKLDSDSLAEGLNQTALPVVHALDKLARSTEEGLFSLPSQGEFDKSQYRLDISLFPPPWLEDKAFLTIRCYLEESYLSKSVLEEAANRNADLIVAPFPPDLYDWADTQATLRSRIADGTRTRDNPDIVRERVKKILSFAVSKEKTASPEQQTLQLNFAKEFPLNRAFPSPYYHVYRDSIRSLLKGTESINGIRLWCSVRRSGKTTACFDLASTKVGSTVVPQTCDDTHQYPNSSLFYERFLEAMQNGSQLPKNFFEAVVKEAAEEAGNLPSRYIFVLDEYETLFERMRLAADEKPQLRYAVFQPLLNQLVAFARNNLLIFIGQRPDAHFIFMDQNQLSPYVEQDRFPLFRFQEGDRSSEFHGFLRKVMTDRVGFDDSFARAVFSETAGHPYLTGKLLICFFDWLIEQDWPANQLEFSGEQFHRFAENHFTLPSLATAREYVFFSQSISRHLSQKHRKKQPWLHAIYSLLRELALATRSFRCSRSEFRQMASKNKLPSELGLQPDSLLASGTAANFFTYDEQSVEPRIKLLARIAGTAQEHVA